MPEITGEMIAAARKHDHDTRPRGTGGTWGSVPEPQVRRLLEGALAAMGPCSHTLLLERAGKALAVLGAMKAEWLCEPCQTIHPHQKGDFISVACPDCAAWMTPTSPLLRDYQTERRRREGAEGKLVEAVLMLGEVRETVTAFLGQYGDSGIPMFKVGQDLANSVLTIINGGVRDGDLNNGAAAAVPDGDEPLTHFFHCWRFPDHHRCAVALIERQAEENDHLIRRAALAERAAREATPETKPATEGDPS